MIQRRFAFILVAGSLVLAGCGGTEQDDSLAVQEDASAAGTENPHADVAGGTGGMPSAHDGDITTAEGVESPHATESAAMPGEGGVTQIMFKCTGDKAFLFALVDGVEKARITLDGTSYELEQIPSDSGMKYGDGTWTFYGRGPEAIVLKNDEHFLTECKAAGHP